MVGPHLTKCKGISILGQTAAQVLMRDIFLIFKTVFCNNDIPMLSLLETIAT